MEQNIHSLARKQRLERGFTLLELLVSVTIMMLIVGGGIASYITFNERQQLAAAAKELQGYFRSAQSRARANEVPDGCTSLQGYSVQVNQDDSEVRLVAECASGDIERATYVLSGTATPNSAINVSFATLKGGVTGAQTITLSQGSRSYSFKVTAGGEITQGDFN